MKAVFILIFLGVSFIHAQSSSGFRLFQPFRVCRSYSEDLGVSVEWSGIDRSNTIGIGSYYAIQTSSMGAGIWYHLSGFATAEITPDLNGLDLCFGGNAGVSFIMIETKFEYSLSASRFSFVPAVGLGLNRILYGMADYHIIPGKNRWGVRLVLRVPVLTRVDKNVSGYTPAYN